MRAVYSLLLFTFLSLPSLADNADKKAIHQIIANIKYGRGSDDGTPFGKPFLDLEGAR
ncbi:hypothetical protein [Kordiimonas sp.]|uniref:hypothetical protein n=1 Tax=Kordiimonas sp. TaxID=1970157 RepID=UPI003A951507